MKLGIVGRPKTGKTTLFNLLTRSHQSVDKFGAVRETHVGTAHVPDPRLDRLSALFKPKKHTPATVEFVDVPGIAKGEQEKIDLSALKSVDVLVHVLRAFEDPDLPHEGGVDPARDAKALDEELVLSDYVLLEKRREKLEKERKKNRSPELDAEWAAIEKCLPALEAATPLRAAGLSPDDEKRLRGFTLLSLKPLLLVVNVSDADAAAEPVERFGLQALRLAAARGRRARRRQDRDGAERPPRRGRPGLPRRPRHLRTGNRPDPPRLLPSPRRPVVLHGRRGRVPGLDRPRRAPPPSSAPGRSTPTSPAGSSGPRSFPSRSSSTLGVARRVPDERQAEARGEGVRREGRGRRPRPLQRLTGVTPSSRGARKAAGPAGASGAPAGARPPRAHGPPRARRASRPAFGGSSRTGIGIPSVGVMSSSSFFMARSETEVFSRDGVAGLLRDARGGLHLDHDRGDVVHATPLVGEVDEAADDLLERARRGERARDLVVRHHPREAVGAEEEAVAVPDRDLDQVDGDVRRRRRGRG